MSATRDHLSALREVELKEAFRGISARKHVLEIGGGNGFQAALLSDAGHSVESLDINVNIGEKQYFPVKPYDGMHIPYANASFDLIFSSNVLEHVEHLPELLMEMQRVLRPGGQAVHLLPSSTWRLFTIGAHYLALLRRVIFGRRKVDNIILEAPVADVIRRRGWVGMLGEAIVPGPHGVFDSSLDEILEYRRQAWIARFESAGWATVETRPAGLFYTGLCLFPHLSFCTRRALAMFVGSACTIYVAVPQAQRLARIPAR